MQCGYIGENKHHLKTRIEEHSRKHKNSHILKHNKHTQCTQISNSYCFDIIDCDNSHFRFQVILIQGSHVHILEEANLEQRNKTRHSNFSYFGYFILHFLFPFPNSLVFPRQFFLFHKLILLLLF